jgi:hypothetical protein
LDDDDADRLLPKVALLVRGEKAVKANADTDVVATRATTATESLMVLMISAADKN